MTVVNSTDPLADLVMAMLAVNQWRIEQSAAIFDSLKGEGLFDPKTILSKEHGELGESLRRAGYKKSAYVIDLLCDRLHDMALKFEGDGRRTFEMFCNNKDKAQLRELLLLINGVGPRVIENFFSLRGL